MIRSLRYRLLISASLSSVVVLALLGVGIYVAMRHALMTDFDNSLKTDARLLSGMVERSGKRVTFEFDAQQMPDFVTEKEGRFFQIWQEDGRVLARSPSLGSHDLKQAQQASDQVASIELPGDHHGRAASLVFTPKQDEEDDDKTSISPIHVRVLVAAEPKQVFHTLAQLGWLLTILCAIAVFLMGVLLLRVVARGLQPVTKLAGEIGSLDETGLRRRLSVDGVSEELVPVVDKLNGLLERLENAFTRERSFTADVAHELRTPLTGLSMTLEVCRSRARNSSEYETAIDECVVILSRMEAMVESLLLLARSDSGRVEIQRERIDMASMITTTWSLFQHRAQLRSLKATFELPESITVNTDSEKLRIVMQNVLDNAVSYADDCGHIRMTLRENGDGVVAEFANSGSQIAPEALPRIFDRFWRGDAARTASGVHCGLGLSLTKRLMDLLGGEISVESTVGGEFIVKLGIR